jgi:hypothetical protein
MIECALCKTQVKGDAFVVGDDVVHISCFKAYRGVRSGRSWKCPVCHTNGKVRHPTKTLTVRDSKPSNYDEPCGYDGCQGCAACQSNTYLVEEPMMVDCDLCEGSGYLENEPKAVWGVV